MKIKKRKGVRFVKFKSVFDRNNFLKACLDHLTHKPGFLRVALDWPKGMTCEEVLKILRADADADKEKP